MYTFLYISFSLNTSEEPAVFAAILGHDLFQAAYLNLTLLLYGMITEEDIRTSHRLAHERVERSIIDGRAIRARLQQFASDALLEGIQEEMVVALGLLPSRKELADATQTTVGNFDKHNHGKRVWPH